MTNVMYVSGLKNNLIFVAVWEVRGYDVVFSKSKSFLKHVAAGQVKHIGVIMKNIYKLKV